MPTTQNDLFKMRLYFGIIYTSLKKLQQAKSQVEKEDILKALKNSSIVYYSFINMFGTYDFTSYSKRVYNLIAIDEEKEFIQPLGLGN